MCPAYNQYGYVYSNREVSIKLSGARLQTGLSKRFVSVIVYTTGTFKI